MLNIIIADDHPIFRAGLKSILCNNFEHVLVHEAADRTKLRQILSMTPADLLLLDIFFPGLEPEADIQILHKQHPLMAILLVSMLSDRRAVERLLRAGANGFVSKSAPPGCMKKGLEKVMAGECPIYLPVSGYCNVARGNDNLATALPKRQLEVLRLICLGYSNKDIARELSLSISTIRAHVSALFQKLGVSNRAAAASFGTMQGVLDSCYGTQSSLAKAT